VNRARPKGETEQPNAALNRMVQPETLEWTQGVLLLALGGFVGNFGFSLSDHAENGFFYPIEWVPVVASALAIGFLMVPLLMRVTDRYFQLRLDPLARGGRGSVGLCGARCGQASWAFGPRLRQFHLWRSPACAASVPESNDPRYHRSVAASKASKQHRLSRLLALMVALRWE
jgi:hypothetical protein